MIRAVLEFTEFKGMVTPWERPVVRVTVPNLFELARIYDVLVALAVHSLDYTGMRYLTQAKSTLCSAANRLISPGLKAGALRRSWQIWPTAFEQGISCAQDGRSICRKSFLFLSWRWSLPSRLFWRTTSGPVARFQSSSPSLVGSHWSKAWFSCCCLLRPRLHISVRQAKPGASSG